MIFSGRRYAVVGLGRSGLAASRALIALGAKVDAWDDREEVRTAAGDLPMRDPLGSDFEYDALVLSPGIPHLLPRPHPAAVRARADGVPILSDAELLFQAVRLSGSRARFIGITGTNGKSTTTALLAHILASAGIRVEAGGNLGPTALALPILPGDAAYVIEMSSYMLERLVGLHFAVAAMLNISPDHLDRHGDMQGYIAAKRAIFERCDCAVAGVDDEPSRAIASDVGAVTISGCQPADVWCHGRVLRDDAGPILDLEQATALPGIHNAQNAAAAYAMARALGIARNEIARAIPSFPGLPHRQQRVARIRGVLFINDSKATNADAAARALGCYERIAWIAGGIAKAGGIAPLAPLFPRIERALLIGQDAPALGATLAAHGVPFEISATLDRAVPVAFATGAPVVLLSPACASFDQYSGFEARGEHFMRLVADLVRAEAA
ncbi:MAG: UDP-N-acetylmuramoyl-L-alanine--D-glutamate ligase [Acetobacteraceae bacterium]|nr:UDP-N-acetylmuramoyl-L-alanine--D-glutamate ligase [Acetobacteraceae bacterium]